MGNSEQPGNLIGMSLECGRKLENAEEAIQAQLKHVFGQQLLTQDFLVTVITIALQCHLSKNYKFYITCSMFLNRLQISN